MKKLFLSLSVLLGMSISAYAQQDAQFSQYMFNGIYINPAYAGYKEQLNLHAFYRTQWAGLDGAPKTASVAVDGTANDGNVGLAFQVGSDKIGAQSALTAYANYAQRVRVGENSRLSLGVGLGVAQLGLDASKLTTTDQENGFGETGINQSVITPDIRAGVFYSNERIYAGFSADNLLAQYMKFNDDPSYLVPKPKPHYYLTAGGLIPLSESILLRPSTLLKDDRGGPTSLDLNAFLLFNERIWFGLSYRTAINLYKKDHLNAISLENGDFQTGKLNRKNAIVFLAEVYATERIRVGYAYDHALSQLADANVGGAHEISLGYYFTPRKERMLSPRYF